MADDFGKRLELLARSIADEKIMNEIAFYIRNLIEERTLAGQFLNPDARKQYSDLYAEKREARNLPTDRVDLQFSGAMWGSFDHNVDLEKLQIELGFNREELAKIASYHDVHGAGRNKIIREFLGLTEAELEEVNNFIIEKYGQQIDITLNKNLPAL